MNEPNKFALSLPVFIAECRLAKKNKHGKVLSKNTASPIFAESYSTAANSCLWIELTANKTIIRSLSCSNLGVHFSLIPQVVLAE